MKTLCFILSLYVFFLTVAPCCSDDDCNDAIAESQSQTPKEEGDCNACSPFLDCGTCNGFVFTNLRIDIDEFPAIENQFVPVYKSQFPDDFFYKIWQPPKII